MWVVVTYDVSTEEKAGQKRLRRVAKVCEKYGQRVQKSVFECEVDEMTFEKLRARLLGEINANEDSLRIYRLYGSHESSVEQHGVTRTIFFKDPLVV